MSVRVFVFSVVTAVLLMSLAMFAKSAGYDVFALYAVALALVSAAVIDVVKQYRQQREVPAVKFNRQNKAGV